MPPFPAGFGFGVATSAYQVEGGLPANNWAQWETLGSDSRPTILGGDRCGRAADSWNRFATDLDLLAWLGVDIYRFSVEWSRIEPRPGSIDETALERYRHWCQRLRLSGIRPMVTLHHFTEPSWVTAGGGFAAKETVDAWVRFVERVVAALGDEVADWITVNEPVGYAVQGWVRGLWPPGRRDPKLACRVLENLLEGHARAYRAIHAQVAAGEEAGRAPCRVGLAHHIVPFRPRRPRNPADRLAARALDRAYNHAVPTALATGDLRIRLPGLTHRARHPAWVGTQDFLGVNHYYPLTVAVGPKSCFAGDEHGFGVTLGPSGRADVDVDDLGLDLDPDSMTEALLAMERYGLPLVVTEHGVCDGATPDLRRCHGLTDALTAIQRLISSGVDIRGYLHWSLVDNFEWAYGWGARFGLFRLDRETMARTPTAGAEHYRELIAAQRRAHRDGRQGT